MTRSTAALIANVVANTTTQMANAIFDGTHRPMQMSKPIPNTPETILATLTPEQRTQMDTELKNSRIVYAVKLLRTVTGCGLKEGVDTVRSLGYMGGPIKPYHPFHTGTPEPVGNVVTHTPETILAALTPEQRAEVNAELKANRSLYAIKIIRANIKCGLKEAVDTIGFLGYGPAAYRFSQPATPTIKVGQIVTLNNRQTHAHKSGTYRQSGKWEVIGIEDNTIRFQKRRADDSGLIPRKTTSIGMSDFIDGISSGTIRL